MNTIVIYKSKYGSTKQYAQWIAEELDCEAVDAKTVKDDDLLKYDNIVYGGGLYAEVINGVTLITKNLEKLGIKDKVTLTRQNALILLQTIDKWKILSIINPNTLAH